MESANRDTSVVLRKIFRLFLFAAVVIGSSIPLFGQSYGINCDTTCGGSTVEPRASINEARGLGSMISPANHVGSATIVEGSQSFTYTVPLFNLQGRNNLNLPLNLYYNSAVWAGYTFNSDHDNPSPGFRLDFGYIDNQVGLLTEPSGGKHALAATGTNASLLFSSDSSYIQVAENPNTVAGSPFVATFKNGLQITYTYIGGYLYRPTQIEDTNGNLITITYLNNSSDPSLNHLSIQSIKDTVGHTINFFYDSTGTMLQCVTTAANCTTPNSQTYIFSWKSYALNFNFNSSSVNMITSDTMNTASRVQPGTQSINVLTGVQRPDGTSVSFSYGDWGIMNKVQELSASGLPRYSAAYNYPSASAGALTLPPTFTQQTISDGVNTGIWNYQATLISTANVKNMVSSFSVTDPCGTRTTTSFSAGGDWQDGLPTQTQISSAPPQSPPANCSTVPSQTWRTTKNAWTSDNSSLGTNPRLGGVTTILEDNSQSQVVYNTYDASGNATDILQYDLGAGAPGGLLREAITSFAPLGNHILDRPSDVQILDGNKNVVLHKKFNYDETAVKSVNPLPVMHDDTNYSPSSSNARGNLTSTVVYTNAATGTGPITTTVTYDEFGNALTSTMGCCTLQQTNFSSTTQYAYPDSVVIGPTGNQLTTSYVYNMSRHPGLHHQSQRADNLLYL